MFLDFASVFDCVCHDGFTCKLVTLGVCGPMVVRIGVIRSMARLILSALYWALICLMFTPRTFVRIPARRRRCTCTRTTLPRTRRAGVKYSFIGDCSGQWTSSWRLRLNKDNCVAVKFIRKRSLSHDSIRVGATATILVDGIFDVAACSGI